MERRRHFVHPDAAGSPLTKPHMIAKAISQFRILRTHPGLWLALGIGLTLKIVLLATDSVSFHSDEAVLGLMARHILQGHRPIFFYGQLYMGALDAYLIAASFAIFGQTVLAIRLVQVILYLATLGTTYGLAWRITHNRFAATAAALLFAIPPVMVSVYTTATLGDYQEILLLNNLIFWIVWDIFDGKKQSSAWWFLAGILAGLGWWSLALIIVSLAPLTLQGLWHFRRKLPMQKIATLLLGFLIGAAPWVYAVADYGPSAILNAQSRPESQEDSLAETDLEGSGNQVTRLISLLLFNLPSLFGLKPSWSIDWIAPLIGIPLVMMYILILWGFARRVLARKETVFIQMAFTSILIGSLALMFTFVMFPSGGDPTGRYILPLYPLLAILIGEWISRQQSQAPTRPYRTWLTSGFLILLLGYNLWGNVRSIRDNPPGLTTQFSEISDIPNSDDDTLIDFLDSIGVNRGYTSYWVSYRFAFLTHERILLVPLLPYKEDLSYGKVDNRYPTHVDEVTQADEVVYVTANHPELDRQLRERFTALEINFDEKRLGRFTIFYHLSRHVAPQELAPFMTPNEDLSS